VTRVLWCFRAVTGMGPPWMPLTRDLDVLAPGEIRKLRTCASRLPARGIADRLASDRERPSRVVAAPDLFRRALGRPEIALLAVAMSERLAASG